MRVIKIKYKNWKGVVAVRAVTPICVTFTSTDWHPEDQWILTAKDVDKDEIRHFALKDIQEFIE